MPRYERLTCDEVKDESSLQNRKKTIGLVPYILIFVLILTAAIGVFYTYQGIEEKHREELNYHKQISLIQKTNVEISEELIDLQGKRERIKKDNEEKEKKILELEEKITSLKKTNGEMKIKWNDNFEKEHEFQISLDALTKINTELENQKNDGINQHRAFKKKLREKSERLTHIQSSIIETEGELKQIEEWLKRKQVNSKCYYDDEIQNQAKQFHLNCDNISPTLILYKTKTFERFGAFTTKPWNGEQGRQDSDSFLFSMNHMELFSYNGRCPSNILITDQTLLPSFGESTTKYDLLIEEKNDQLIAHSGPLVCFGETEGEKGTLFGCNKAVISKLEVYSLK